MIAQKVASIKNTVSSSAVFLRPYRWKARYFKPKVLLAIESKKFLIKTAENGHELERVLNLRYEVFHEEVLHKKSFLGVDVDRFDSICDHLMIVDKTSEKVVGTYRLISSAYSNSFYSETEFVIDNLKNLPKGKLELGRACVRRDYRNGVTLALLWKGILDYAKRVKAAYLFGCSSVNTMNIIEIALIYKQLKESHFSSEDFRAYPKSKYCIEQLDRYLETFDRLNIRSESTQDLIPSLIKSYLKAGVKICGEPALDKKFKCADFLTVLDLNQLNKSFERYKATDD